jgi:uncharacterized membrane protein
MLQGLFWLLPIVAMLIILTWLYKKVTLFVASIFHFIGFVPKDHEFLWGVLVIVVIVLILYMLGWFVRTRFANIFEYFFTKIPGYSTLEGLVGIFNSSKEGDNQVLVVLIRGFAAEGYNVGLMYSQKESIVKDHYTVTLSMSPIPNGGYMFEVHKDNIYVLEGATFDDNLQYLLSMGIKSLADIIPAEPKTIDELPQLSEWLVENDKNNSKNNTNEREDND